MIEPANAGRIDGGYRAPFHIGVTGHRAPADIPNIVSRIAATLRRIEESSPGVSLVVISALAEGADRLVAMHALDHRPDARLLALLPMPVEEYVKDFASPESKAEFEELLARSTCVIELPLAPSRAESYRAAGVAVLDRCDVLIAIWDGKKDRGRGGTAEIVRLARKRGLPIAWIHDRDRNGGKNKPAPAIGEAGALSYENFENVGGASRAGGASACASDAAGALPYRIRIGVAAEGAAEAREIDRETIELILPAAVLSLFDTDSRKRLDSAQHTPIAFGVVSGLRCDAECRLAGAIMKALDASSEITIPRDLPAFLCSFSSQPERERAEALCRVARSPIVLDTGVQLDRHIADHSDLIFVLEDPNGNSGGRASISALAERRGLPVIRIRAGSQCRVRVARGQGIHDKSITRLDRFNRVSATQGEMKIRGRNVEEEMSCAENSHVPIPENKRFVRKMLLPHYVVVSRLAESNRRLYHRAGSLVWLLFPLAIAAVAVGIHFPPLAAAAFSVEFVLLATIAVVVILADRRRSLQSWIEARFLAERLRCAAFIAACGQEASPIRVSQRGGAAWERDQWMVLAFNEIWSRLPLMRGVDAASCESVREFVHREWVAKQIDYHERTATDLGRKGRWLERLGTAMFLLALLAAAIHVFESLSRREATPSANALTFAAIVLPAVGAALGGFRNLREYSRLAKRSSSMSEDLRALQRRLSEADGPEGIRRALLETEETMLRETQEWLMLMRFAPVKYPG